MNRNSAKKLLLVNTAQEQKYFLIEQYLSFVLQVSEFEQIGEKSQKVYILSDQTYLMYIA